MRKSGALRRCALALLGASVAMSGLAARPAPAATDAEVEAFLARLAPGAKDGWHRFGVPASVTLAQAALESGWGTSKLSSQHNNYFGIKCNDNGLRSPYQNGCVDMLTTEYNADGSSYQIVDQFRTYASPAMSMLDHGYYLKTRGLYDKAFTVNEDPKQFIYWVHKGGYATDPDYANYVYNKLIVPRNLTRFDWRTGVGSGSGVGGASTELPPVVPSTPDPQVPKTPVEVSGPKAGLPGPGTSVTPSPSTSSAPLATATPSTSSPVPTALAPAAVPTTSSPTTSSPATSSPTTPSPSTVTVKFTMLPESSSPSSTLVPSSSAPESRVPAADPRRPGLPATGA